MLAADFIAKWRAADSTERAAAQSHFCELCTLLGDRDGGCDDVVVIGIAADRANIGRRSGKQPADLFQSRAPPNDRLSLWP